MNSPIPLSHLTFLALFLRTGNIQLVQVHINLDDIIGFSLGQQNNCLHVLRVREHIDGLDFSDFVFVL